MYSYLEGKISEKSPVLMTLDCNGIGFEINIPLSTFDQLKEVGEITRLYIHYSFNEQDGTKLYGFLTKLEKQLFRLLISVSKIGPKLGLGILSGLPAKDLISAIVSENSGLIATIPGIGKKTAERLIIELKDKVTILGGKPENIYKVSNSDFIQEAESALITLGYKQFEIRKMIAGLVKENEFNSSEEVVKAVIKSLYRKRNI
jgi:Holliday junction DNA helicase RuvA